MGTFRTTLLRDAKNETATNLSLNRFAALDPNLIDSDDDVTSFEFGEEIEELAFTTPPTNVLTGDPSLPVDTIDDIIVLAEDEFAKK